MVNEKQEYAQTLATLLSLDRVMIKDLMRLEIGTLAKMYTNYIQNAKDANHAMERLQDAYKQEPASCRDRSTHRTSR